MLYCSCRKLKTAREILHLIAKLIKPKFSVIQTKLIFHSVHFFSIIKYLKEQEALLEFK